jgi:preprotein translocase subunit SecG
VTFFLGFVFILNTVALGYFYAQQKNKSVVDAMIEKNDVAAPTINIVNDTNKTK